MTTKADNDTPLADAIKHNEVRIEGGVSKQDGGEIHGTFEHDIERKKGTLSFGADGGIGEKKGGFIKGFLKWVWR